MSDIELVIKIPEVFYEALRKTDIIISGQRSGKTLMSVISDAVANGTSIPKGRGINMSKINWNEIDKQEIKKSVVLLDVFAKTYCRYQNDYERFDDLEFRCDECPFQKENGDCLVKVFKNKYAPDYRDFGSMGDL